MKKETLLNLAVEDDVTEQKTANNLANVLDNLHRKIVRNYEFSRKVTEEEIMSLVLVKNLLAELEQYRALNISPGHIEVIQERNVAMSRELTKYRRLGTVEDIQLVYSRCKDLEKQKINIAEESKIAMDKQLESGWIPFNRENLPSIGETYLIAPKDSGRGVSASTWNSYDIAYLTYPDEEKVYGAIDGVYSFDEIKALSYLPQPTGI